MKGQTNISNNLFKLDYVFSLSEMRNANLLEKRVNQLSANNNHWEKEKETNNQNQKGKSCLQIVH